MASWILHAIGGEFYKPVAERHTQFGYPRLVIASFVGTYGVSTLWNIVERVAGPD
jgi:hypothetical protein